MRTYVKIAVVASSLALTLSASTAFAEGRLTQEGQSRIHPIDVVATTTGIYNTVRHPLRLAKVGPEKRLAALGSTTPGSMRAEGRPALLLGERLVQLRARVQERLTTLRDKVKQQMIEHVSTMFDRINKDWTNHLNEMT